MREGLLLMLRTATFEAATALPPLETAFPDLADRDWRHAAVSEHVAIRHKVDGSERGATYPFFMRRMHCSYYAHRSRVTEVWDHCFELPDAVRDWQSSIF
jgi:hypothetical protein